jgi:hypothetical protein
LQEYLNKKLDEIPVDERFLHRHATSRIANEGEGKLGKSRKGEMEEDWDDDVESVNSDEFETILGELWERGRCVRGWVR